jgi:hypothetical protein
MTPSPILAGGVPASVTVHHTAMRGVVGRNTVDMHKLLTDFDEYKRGVLYRVLQDTRAKAGVQWYRFDADHAKRHMEAVGAAFTAAAAAPGLYPWQQRSLAFVAAVEARAQVTLRFPDLYLPSDRDTPTVACAHGLVHATSEADAKRATIMFFPPMTLTVACDAPGGLLASDVGTGKTAVLLQRVLDTAGGGRTLVVVPNTLEGQWVCEMQRVWGARYAEAEAAKGKRKARDVPGDALHVWRASTLTGYWKAPPRWDVMLTTFEFLTARLKEAVPNRKAYCRPVLTPEASRAAAAAGDYPTLFMDVAWERVIVDEAEDALANLPQPVLDFVADLPARHAWVMTATPANYTGLAALMRLRLVRAVTDAGEDVTRAVAKYGVDWQASAVAAHCAFRVTKAAAVDVHRARIVTRTVDLTLSQEERQVLDYMRLTGRDINDALVCTDVDSFLQDALAHAHPNESRVMTMDDFWAAMRTENALDGRAVDEEIAAIRARLEELASVAAALAQDGEEWRRVRTEMRAQEKKYEARRAVQAKHAASATFLKNLGERIEHARDNPCSICACDIGEGRLAITVCGHVFCIDCLTGWLATNAICPMCRRRPLVLADVTVVDAGAVAKPAAPAPRKYSTKIDFLLAHLRHLFATTEDKVIVFTHHPRHAAQDPPHAQGGGHRGGAHDGQRARQERQHDPVQGRRPGDVPHHAAQHGAPEQRHGPHRGQPHHLHGHARRVGGCVHAGVRPVRAPGAAQGHPPAVPARACVRAYGGAAGVPGCAGARCGCAR